MLLLTHQNFDLVHEFLVRFLESLDVLAHLGRHLVVLLVVLLILLFLVLHGLKLRSDLVIELFKLVSGLNFDSEVALELGKLVFEGVHALIKLLLQCFQLLALLLELGVGLDVLIKLLGLCFLS